MNTFCGCVHEITDGDIGAGKADTGFILDGMPFSISLKPRLVCYE